MRTDILERKEEILQWISEEQPKDDEESPYYDSELRW